MIGPAIHNAAGLRGQGVPEIVLSEAGERSGLVTAMPDIIPMSALVLGAFAMGASPIFVRFAEVGPLTSAFWRVALALPLLWIWARLETPSGRIAPSWRPVAGSLALAGIFFAGDLTFWHLAVLNTTVANATFMATLAPVWVALGSGLFLGEPVDRRLVVGLGLCLIGGGFLIGESLSVSPENLAGDIYGLITSLFFGGYFIAVRRARRVLGGGRTLFLSSIVTASVLAVEAVSMETQLWPQTGAAIGALLSLAIISHSGGQGLLAFALGHLPAAFSALVIFLEGVAAALLGYLVFNESLGALQAVGAAAIFAGVVFARPRTHRPVTKPL
ncbi:EamA-like transporter family protein [Afifella marina DSM 2698]|uniref:EamA-like transporter family protein n=1 Tax=Afifella marina DSM 2698 TaxID=1120955 RepID=A0A1G5P5X4_AFIMA|nr:EamA-like transporter family protein [Afifella marina DSM 2698]